MYNIIELGSSISDKDISDYLDKIEKEGLINGVSIKWNCKFKLDITKYTIRYKNNPQIHQTQYTILFPYYVKDVGVIPIWSNSYKRVKKLFEDNIEKSEYNKNKRKKLGLE
jgi:hypothetical protein